MSKLKTAKHCLRRFYWENVQRLRLRSTTPYQEATGPENAPPAGASTSSGAAGGPSQGQSRKGKQDRIDPLALGTLVHACLGRFYVTANVQELWSAAEAVKAYYPELALETRRLVAFYLRRFNAEEAATWDVRAVEHESRYYWPARKVAGKRRCLCTSARHDGVYRKRAPGQACIPIGERAPDGVRLHELKTTGSLTGGRIRGFFQNAQIMMNLLAYTYGHSVRVDGTVLAESSAELLGSCDTVTVTHIGKNKAMGNLDISRNDYVVPEARIFGFRDDLADWLFEELFARLFSEHWLEPETWRKDWICSDVYYQGWICPYTQLCEAEEVNWEVNYYQRPDDGFRPEALELPAKLEKQRAARMSASEQIAEGK